MWGDWCISVHWANPASQEWCRGALWCWVLCWPYARTYGVSIAALVTEKRKISVANCKWGTESFNPKLLFLSHLLMVCKPDIVSRCRVKNVGRENSTPPVHFILTPPPILYALDRIFIPKFAVMFRFPLSHRGRQQKGAGKARINEILKYVQLINKMVC